MKTKLERFALLDFLIRSRDQLKMAIDLDDPGLIDHIRQIMIESIMHTYTIDYVLALHRFNSIVEGIDYIDPEVAGRGR